MAYKITFNKNRNEVLEWSDLERQAVLHKKGNEEDVIIIKPEGRNIRSKKFNANIIYSLYDYLSPKERRRKMQIIIAFDREHYPTHTLIRPGKVTTRRTADELFKAIIVTDKEYSRPGGGVLIPFPVWRSPEAMKKLKEALEKSVEKP